MSNRKVETRLIANQTWLRSCYQNGDEGSRCTRLPVITIRSPSDHIDCFPQRLKIRRCRNFQYSEQRNLFLRAYVLVAMSLLLLSLVRTNYHHLLIHYCAWDLSRLMTLNFNLLIYTVFRKKPTWFLPITLANIDRFTKFFYHQTQRRSLRIPSHLKHYLEKFKYQETTWNKWLV